MKRVRMIQTRSGRHNEYQAFRYDAGKTFYLPDNIANLYISQGAAMEDKSVDAPAETKKKRKKKII
jgi:hypothetical protein